MTATIPRLTWAELPTSLRESAYAALGSLVVTDLVQSGGFSPGLASRLELADGRWVFAKAISPGRDPVAPGLYRREIAVMSSMPEGVPAPRLLWSTEVDGWVMLVLECVDGVMPATPWTATDLGLVVEAVASLADALTPSPMDLPLVTEDLAENFSSWRAWTAGPGVPPELGEWAVDHAEDLARLEAGWEEAAKGDTMLHTDLRADNVLIEPSGRVVFVDWPYAVVGASWLDLLFLLTSAAAEGADPQIIWGESRLACGVDPVAANAVLAALAGDFLAQSLRPAPPNLPTLRTHQRGKGEAALAWLARRVS